VALFLVLVLSVGVTYSWIEDLRLVTIDTSDDSKEKHPLSIGKAIDAEYKVSSSSDTINLGLMDYDSTNKYVKQNANGYFYESGDMHLSPCYGDGDSFYFPTQNNDSASYRLGDHDDENVNYISTTLKLYSPQAKTEFWFDSFDVTLKDSNGNTVNADEYIRFSVTVDGSTAVYSKDGTYKTVSGTTASSQSTKTGRVINEYKHGHPSNTSDRGKNGNTLFVIPKYDSELDNKKVVNFKIWLEKNNTVNDVEITNIDIKLLSSWAIGNRRIFLNDKTTGAQGESWMKKDNAAVFLAVPAMSTTGTWQTDANARVQFDLNESKPYVEIPAVYNGEDMYLFRCKSTWNNGNITVDSVKCWNYWSSVLPDTFKDETYSVYGGSYDGTVCNGDGANGNYKNNVIKDDNNHIIYTHPEEPTYLGYGTWDPVYPVYLTDEGDANNTEYVDKSKTHVFVEDYSDLLTAGKVYVYTMARDTTNNIWKVYMPSTSTKIQFKYRKKTDNDDKTRLWGFATMTGVPNNSTDTSVIKSSPSHVTGYERPSDKYTFYVYNKFGNDGKGIGYWGDNGQSSSTPVTPSANTTTITTSEPTSYGFYAYGKLDDDNNWEKYAKFSKNGNDGEIILQLTANTQYGFKFRRGNQGNWTPYGTDQTGNSATVQLSTSQSKEYTIYKASDHDKKVFMSVPATGKYRIKITNYSESSLKLIFEYVSS
jgi:hypothetical protein